MTLIDNIPYIYEMTNANYHLFDNKITTSLKKVGRLGALVGGLTIGALFATAARGNIEFNDSLASVSAITGSTGKDLANLESIAKSTAKETRKSGSEVLKAYELVGSAKPELLENASALDGVTRSVITLSKASRMDLEESTKSLTDVMNQFNKDGTESGKVIDILAAGAKFGAAAIPQISEAIVQFGTVAKSSNVSLQESVAAIEVFASKGIKGAEAGTKMRNVLTTLATAKALPAKALKELSKFGVDLDIVSDKSLPLNKRLKELSKISGDATAMVKVFGKENQGAGAILLNNIDSLDDLTKKVDENGVANVQAGTNTNTFAFALASIKTGFINSTTATNSNNSAMEFLKDTMFSLADNMDTILIAGASVVGLYVLMKAVLLANTIATTAYSIAMGINASRTGAMSLAMKGNLISQNAYKIATGISVAMTWLSTTAFGSLAIAVSAATWPILAVIAAIALIILIFKNWGAIIDWIKRKWLNFTSFISEAWSGVVEFFKEFGFAEFFMDIGRSILKFMLLPLKAVLKLIDLIPGKKISLVQGGLDFISDIENGIDSVGKKEEVLPSTSQASSESVTRSISENNSNISLDIKDSGNNIGNVSSDNEGIPINISNTVGAS